MCIICSSAKGVRQPTEAEIIRMFEANPHGAGYMVARSGKVEISKGYMDLASYLRAIRYEAFTAADSVVYHFRISTQAGIAPSMTHPFPLSARLEDMKELECACSCGVAHNGVIRMTTDPRDTEYSDTARFIAMYMTKIVRTKKDLKDPAILEILRQLTGSRLAIMDRTGYIATVGDWIREDGLLFSNPSFRPLPERWNIPSKNYKTKCKSSRTSSKTQWNSGFPKDALL